LPEEFQLCKHTLLSLDNIALHMQSAVEAKSSLSHAAACA